MSTIYIDTEFNLNTLLSMACISPNGRTWYAAQRLPDGVKPTPWVAANVLPVLAVDPLDPADFRAQFWAFVRHFYEPTVVCTAPADGAHFLSLINDAGGPSTIQFAMDLVIVAPPAGALHPAVPHNALSDAQALMAWHQRMIGGATVARVWL